MTVTVSAAKNAKLAKDVMAFAVQDADATMRPTLRWLYSLYATYNQTYFRDRLPVPYILVGDVHDGYAKYSEVGGLGWVHQVTIKRTVVEGTHKHLQHGTHDQDGLRLFLADVLLHALLDMYMAAVLGEPDPNEKGHGIPFADEANRIGALMTPALAKVGPSRSIWRNGSNRNMARFQGTQPCGEWPWVVRPANYYRGALAKPQRAPKGKAARLMAGLPAQPAPVAAGSMAALQAEIARLQAELSLAVVDRDTAVTALKDVVDLSLVPDAATTKKVVKALKAHAAYLKGPGTVVEAKRLAAVVDDVTRPILGDNDLARNLLMQSAGEAVAASAASGLQAMWAWGKVRDGLVERYGTAGHYADWARDTWRDSLS